MSEKETQQIAEAIGRLHERGSADYETLISRVGERPSVLLNAPQVVASMSRAKLLALEWGRGTGKTTILGHRLRQAVVSMPRSTGLLIAPTYKMALTKIIPSLTQGLEMFGLYEKLHYFIGEQPPRSWRKSWGRAYQAPSKYTTYITFWNGTGIHLISQDVEGDGRGLNSDWIVGDEAALLNPEKLQNDTDPTLRGTKTSAFMFEALFGSTFYSSSTPITQEGAWFIGLEEEAITNPKKAHFIKANCLANAHNLRPGFLEEAKAKALYPWLFDAEYYNIRPSQVRDSFYPLLSERRHTYDPPALSLGATAKPDCTSDTDLVPGVGLTLGIDFGASINCLTANQYLPALNEYRTLKSMFVLGNNNEIQQDLIDNFDTYYAPHRDTCADLYVWYDASGNHRTGMTKLTRAQQVQHQLTAKGWRVQLLTVGGSNPLHDEKHRLWNAILREDVRHIPRYRMNRLNCKELLISMTFAKALKGSDGMVHKDKRSERSTKIERAHATDLSDANDFPIYGLFRNYLYNRPSTAVPQAR